MPAEGDEWRDRMNLDERSGATVTMEAAEDAYHRGSGANRETQNSLG